MLNFFILSLFNLFKIFSSATTAVTENISAQATLLKSTVDNINSTQQVLKTLAYPTNVSDYTIEVYKFEQIHNETYEYAQKAQDFADEAFKAESTRYSYEIACIILIPLLTIGVVVSYKFKKSYIVLIISLILFALIIPACVIMGLNTSYFLLSIDICKDINKYISSDVSAYAEKGLGVYVSCPSKTTQVRINTAKYELGYSFNKIINEVNTTIKNTYEDEDIGIYKRNNSHFKYLADNNYVNDTNVNKGLYSVYYTNNLLQSLSALSKCQAANNVINFSEEKFCYTNITMQFNNLIYYFIGIVGLLILSVGSNKLIVLLNPAYQKLDKTGMELLNESSM